MYCKEKWIGGAPHCRGTLEGELAVTCEQRDALDVECARLEKEVEALRHDAERYRRLVASGKFVPGVNGGWGLGCGAYAKATKQELDAAVDTMKGHNTRA